jgi:hypothetical protein
MRRFLAPAFAVAVVGCASTPRPDPLRQRAAFDLNCQASRLSIVDLDFNTAGVRGCGQQATYVRRCETRAGFADDDCTWIMNDARRPHRDDEE